MTIALEDSHLLEQPPSLDLPKLIARVRRRQIVVWLSVAAALLLAILYLRQAEYQYTLSYAAIPVQSPSDKLSSTLGKVGGLAALAGVSLPQGDDVQFSLYLEGLHSRDVAEILARDPRLMHIVFRKEWDEQRHRWHAPGGPVSMLRSALRRVVDEPGDGWQPPEAARLQEYLIKMVAIAQRPKSVVATISVSRAVPADGLALLTALNAATDELLRHRALDRADHYIAYLTRQLSTVSLAEHRAALSQALGEQERARMTANSGQPFAAELYQLPSSSRQPTSPNLLFVLAAAIALGVVAGIGLALVDFKRGRVADAPPEP